jgi:hypothetical protein
VVGSDSLFEARARRRVELTNPPRHLRRRRRISRHRGRLTPRAGVTPPGRRGPAGNGVVRAMHGCQQSRLDPRQPRRVLPPPCGMNQAAARSPTRSEQRVGSVPRCSEEPHSSRSARRRRRPSRRAGSSARTRRRGPSSML